MKIRLDITPKLTLAFALFAALLLTVVSWLAYTNGRAALEAATIKELYATGLEKRAALLAWIEETQLHAATIANGPAFQEKLTDLLAADSAGDSEAIQTARNNLVAEMQVWSGTGRDYLSWFVLEPQTGRVIASTNAQDEGKFRENQDYFLFGKQGPYVQNAYFTPSAQGLLSTVAAPIRSPDGKLLGVLAGNLDLKVAERIITRRTGLRQSDDAFLVNKSALFVTQPRFLEDPVVLRRGRLTPAIKSCLQRQSGLVKAPDYRGVASIIAYSWLPETQMCLIVKMEQDEAFKPVYALRDAILLISGLALLAACWLAIWLARTILHPLEVLQAGVERFGRGELSVRLPEDSLDELGELSREFNIMAGALVEKEAELQAYANELELKVKQRTEDLRASEERFRIAAESGSDLIWEWDFHEDSLEWYGDIDALLGYEPDEFPRTVAAWSERIHPDDRQADKALLDQHLKVGALYHSEYRVQRKDGSYAVWSDKGVALRDETGVPHKMVGVCSDVTSLRAAEQTMQEYSNRLEQEVEERTSALRAAQEKLVRHERLAVLGLMAGSVGHELRNPLGVISNAVYFLKLVETNASEKVKEYLNIIESETRSADKIISDLSDFSRHRSADRKPVKASEMIHQALDRYPVMQSVSLDLDIPEDLPLLLVDLAQMIQVFGNLMQNACQAMSGEAPSGDMKSGDGILGGRLSIYARQQGDKIVITMKDTGVGISPENLSKIFEPLFTTRAKGIGLGLALCQKLVEANEGRIEVASQFGQGSAFTVFLPIYGKGVA